MNFKRLKYFAKIVDVGSLTQAADLLHIAQPALSQQISTLEGEVHQKLLVRTQRGVTPTEAGKALYRHAQVILRQCEQAQLDMTAVSRGVSGPVSVGLAPGTAATTLALPLLRQVRALHPGITLYLNENYGTTLSELIMNGRMDLAVLYGNRAIHGLSFLPLLDEALFLVGPSATAAPVRLAELAGVELFLPRPYNIVRKLVDEHFARAGMVPRVVAEIESAATLAAIIADGLGLTILPASMAREVVGPRHAWCRRIVDPVIEAPLTLCQSDHLPLSEPAEVVKAMLMELAGGLKSWRPTAEDHLPS
ncbi:nitrogen assimilation transcriptional regulator NAC [Acidisphaera sp. L21]|uniref:nitrogen assimilation transcriptional regulator NAC n=1 Tax=Acidisphaera sp. L21 TaxID=1641851 RepID=UPI001C204562|nr:nitrogen assimilation transcriptional regulator NAC [Acidisphaera sp. L21]